MCSIPSHLSVSSPSSLSPRLSFFSYESTQKNSSPDLALNFIIKRCKRSHLLGWIFACVCARLICERYQTTNIYGTDFHPLTAESSEGLFAQFLFRIDFMLGKEKCLLHVNSRSLVCTFFAQFPVLSPLHALINEWPQSLLQASAPGHPLC